MTIKPDLNGRVALVTGGSRGIGAAIAATLAEAGAAVAVNYREHASEADAVVATIEAMGRPAIAVAADVSQAAAVVRMVDHVTRTLGPIDILINNAGIAIVRGIDDLTESEFDQTIAVNLKSAFLCTTSRVAGDAIEEMGPYRQYLVRRRARRRSHRDSLQRLKGRHGRVDTRLRGRLVKEGITVNAVSPSLIENRHDARPAAISPATFRSGAWASLAKWRKRF